jgi:hypothetical protein
MPGTLSPISLLEEPCRCFFLIPTIILFSLARHAIRQRLALRRGACIPSTRSRSLCRAFLLFDGLFAPKKKWRAQGAAALVWQCSCLFVAASQLLKSLVFFGKISRPKFDKRRRFKQFIRSVVSTHTAGFALRRGTMSSKKKPKKMSPKATDTCPCGSGKAFQSCHGAWNNWGGPDLGRLQPNNDDNSSSPPSSSLSPAAPLTAGKGCTHSRGGVARLVTWAPYWLSSLGCVLGAMGCHSRSRESVSGCLLAVVR